MAAKLENNMGMERFKLNGFLIRSALRRQWKLYTQERPYEHIIRDGNDYARIVEYIHNNPLNWADDEYNV